MTDAAAPRALDGYEARCPTCGAWRVVIGDN
jgi:hypothetical protein